MRKGSVLKLKWGNRGLDDSDLTVQKPRVESYFLTNAHHEQDHSGVLKIREEGLDERDGSKCGSTLY